MRSLILEKRPVVIAHRGYSGLVTENTAEAVEAALACGAHAVELDVRFTSDGELVVFHDERTARLTDVNLRVSEEPLEKLMSLRLHGSGRILRLAEAFRVVDGRVPLNLEVKDPGAGEKVLELMRREEYRGEVVISSFIREEVERVRIAKGDALLSLLASRPTEEDVQAAVRLGCVSLNVNRRRVTKELVKRVHREGLFLLAYTVNDEREFLRLFGLGVDGFFTNYPGEMLEWREKIAG